MEINQVSSWRRWWVLLASCVLLSLNLGCFIWWVPRSTLSPQEIEAERKRYALEDQADEANRCERYLEENAILDELCFSTTTKKLAPREYCGRICVFTMRGMYSKAIIYAEEIESGRVPVVIDELTSEGLRIWHARALSEYGDYAAADRMFRDRESISFFKEYLAAHDWRTDNLDRAAERTYEQYEFCRQRGLARADHIGKQLTMLGKTLYYHGEYARAIPLFEQAYETTMHGVAQPDCFADVSTMLARTRLKFGGEQEAQRLLRSVIRATKHDGLRSLRAEAHRRYGDLFLRADALTSAAQQYQAASQLYYDMGRDGHPDAADALKGLADVALKRDELTSATVYCERALNVFDGSILPDHPRMMPTLVALAALDTLTSKSSSRVEERFSRLDACQKKPLGIWREDLQDTLELYTPLLRSRGHGDSAERLNRYLTAPPKLTFVIPDGLTAETGPPPQFIERSRQ